MKINPSEGVEYSFAELRAIRAQLQILFNRMRKTDADAALIICDIEDKMHIRLTRETDLNP